VVLPYHPEGDLEPGWWGVLPESRFGAWGSLMEPDLDLTGRQAARDAADRIRAWLDSYGGRYQRIALLAEGPLMNAWTQGARGTRSASRVKILKAGGALGMRHPRLRRELAASVSP
jgi:hypothetical protein